MVFIAIVTPTDFSEDETKISKGHMIMHFLIPMRAQIILPK
jgi:hypothetical protein